MADYQNTSRIIRKADITKNFSIIPNHIAQSTKLSPNAKSLIIHLLSMPDDWYYVKTQFWKRTNMGRDAFNRAWKELESLGYIQSERIIEGNLVRGFNYTISDMPIFGLTEIHTVRDTDNPNISKQLKTKATNTNNTNTNNTNEELQSNSSSSKLISLDVSEFYNQEKMDRTSPLEGEVHHIYSADEFMDKLISKLKK